MTLAEQIAEQLGISSTSVMVVNDGEEIYINGNLWNLEDWHEPTYSKRIRAPKTLALEYPQIYVWFQINDLPIHKEGAEALLYCNEILAEHQPLVDSLGSVTVENRPEPEDA